MLCQPVQVSEGELLQSYLGPRDLLFLLSLMGVFSSTAVKLVALSGSFLILRMFQFSLRFIWMGGILFIEALDAQFSILVWWNII